MSLIVITFFGKAGCGKNTAAEAIENHSFKADTQNGITVAFADELKRIAFELGWDGKKDDRGRRLLQKLGTDVAREYDESVWVDKVGGKITTAHFQWRQGLKLNEPEPAFLALVTDGRFENELEWAQHPCCEYGIGVPVLIRRKLTAAQKKELGVQGSNAKHASENSLPDDESKYAVIIDNDSDEDTFKEKVVTGVLDYLRDNHEIIL